MSRSMTQTTTSAHVRSRGATSSSTNEGIKTDVFGHDLSDFDVWGMASAAFQEEIAERNHRTSRSLQHRHREDEQVRSSSPRDGFHVLNQQQEEDLPRKDMRHSSQHASLNVYSSSNRRSKTTGSILKHPQTEPTRRKPRVAQDAPGWTLPMPSLAMNEEREEEMEEQVHPRRTTKGSRKSKSSSSSRSSSKRRSSTSHLRTNEPQERYSSGEPKSEERYYNKGEPRPYHRSASVADLKPRLPPSNHRDDLSRSNHRSSTMSTDNSTTYTPSREPQYYGKRAPTSSSTTKRPVVRRPPGYTDSFHKLDEFMKLRQAQPTSAAEHKQPISSRAPAPQRKAPKTRMPPEWTASFNTMNQLFEQKVAAKKNEEKASKRSSVKSTDSDWTASMKTMEKAFHTSSPNRKNSPDNVKETQRILNATSAAKLTMAVKAPLLASPEPRRRTASSTERRRSKSVSGPPSGRTQNANSLQLHQMLENQKWGAAGAGTDGRSVVSKRSGSNGKNETMPSILSDRDKEKHSPSSLRRFFTDDSQTQSSVSRGSRSVYTTPPDLSGGSTSRKERSSSRHRKKHRSSRRDKKSPRQKDSSSTSSTTPTTDANLETKLGLLSDHSSKASGTAVEMSYRSGARTVATAPVARSSRSSSPSSRRRTHLRSARKSTPKSRSRSPSSRLGKEASLTRIPSKESLFTSGSSSMSPSGHAHRKSRKSPREGSRRKVKADLEGSLSPRLHSPKTTVPVVPSAKLSSFFQDDSGSNGGKSDRRKKTSSKSIAGLPTIRSEDVHRTFVTSASRRRSPTRGVSKDDSFLLKKFNPQSIRQNLQDFDQDLFGDEASEVLRRSENDDDEEEFPSRRVAVKPLRSSLRKQQSVPTLAQQQRLQQQQQQHYSPEGDLEKLMARSRPKPVSRGATMY